MLRPVSATPVVSCCARANDPKATDCRTGSPLFDCTWAEIRSTCPRQMTMKREKVERIVRALGGRGCFPQFRPEWGQGSADGVRADPCPHLGRNCGKHPRPPNP